MRRSSFIYFVCTFMILALFSCSQENESSITSVTEMMFEGEDSVAVIPTKTANWNISCVYNPDGIPIYDINGIPLHLKGLGEISSSWFKITRTSSTGFKVEVSENFDAGTRGLVIELSQGIITEDVTIRQKRSEGYTFYKIEYTMEDGDGVSESTQQVRQLSTVIVNKTNTPQKMVVYPYQDVKTSSVFTSDDATAFSWASGGEVDVKIPAYISHGSIFFSDKLMKYSKENVTDQNNLIEQMVDVAPMTKTTAQIQTVKMSKMQVTFNLTLISRRTKAEKHITGKWYQETPVDCDLKVTNESLK